MARRRRVSALARVALPRFVARGALFSSRLVCLVSDWRTLAISLDAFTRAAIDEMNKAASRVVSPLVGRDAYFQANRDGDKSAGVVKCSDVLQAAHLMAARVTIRAMPENWANALKEFAIDKIGGAAVAKALELAKNLIPGPAAFRAVITAAATAAVKAEIEKKVEHTIRNECTAVRNSFQDLILDRSEKPESRRVRDVRTRNASKPKRREKKWKSC